MPRTPKSGRPPKQPIRPTVDGSSFYRNALPPEDQEILDVAKVGSLDDECRLARWKLFVVTDLINNTSGKRVEPEQLQGYRDLQAGILNRIARLEGQRAQIESKLSGVSPAQV